MQEIKIYSLNCPITNMPFYIGQSKNEKERYYKHIKLGRADGFKTRLYAYIRNILNQGLLPKMEILDIVNSDESDFWEQHYIFLYRSFGFELKNIAFGGRAKKGFSYETKMILRERNLGKKLSAKTKDKIRKTSKEVWNRPEMKEQQRQRTLSAYANGFTGLKGKTTKKKGQPFAGDRKLVSESLKKYFLNPENRLKNCIAQGGKEFFVYTKTGAFVKSFINKREAEKELNVHNSNMLQCLNGKRKSSNGFKFSYEKLH